MKDGVSGNWIAGVPHTGSMDGNATFEEVASDAGVR
jgi:hypothetical protein